MKRAGVDVGGTFTDVVVIDEDGQVTQNKVPSNPQHLERSVVDGLVRTLGGDEHTADLGFLGHGTTVATNVTLERTGPRVAMICTRGFRDIIEIARLARPGEKLYTLKDVMPDPVVARADCFEVTERVNAAGQVVAALDEDEVREAITAIAARGITSLAVCLMFSFRNPGHERRIREIAAEAAPGIQVSISSEVWPEFREYERASTTSLNSYLKPSAWKYLSKLQDACAEAFPNSSLWVMQSNGGLTTADSASDQPVRLVMSGPAGGVIGARCAAQQTGLGNLLAVDMGGTSFDVSLLQGGQATLVDRQEVMGLPLQGRALDIMTIGSGGGSIAWVDAAGQFRVGPRSAGAYPGPACYGRGGTEPTVTDANYVLGLFSPDSPIAGGDLELDFDAAYTACATLGAKLGLTAVETAWGIRQIVNASMAGAVRTASVRRGLDPRDFALLGFGGAGPLHAADIASEMGITEVSSPPSPAASAPWASRSPTPSTTSSTRSRASSTPMPPGMPGTICAGSWTRAPKSCATAASTMPSTSSNAQPTCATRGRIRRSTSASAKRGTSPDRGRPSTPSICGSSGTRCATSRSNSSTSGCGRSARSGRTSKPPGPPRRPSRSHRAHGRSSPRPGRRRAFPSTTASSSLRVPSSQARRWSPPATPRPSSRRAPTPASTAADT